MAGKGVLSDDELRDYLDKGVTQSHIASLLHVTPQAIHNRVKGMETKLAKTSAAVAIVATTVTSMWDTKNAAEQNYQRCLDLLDECETATERTRVLGEIRQHLQFGVQVVETLFTVQETKDFMNEVLDVIGQLDPDARNTIIRRLAEKRTLRSVFLPHQ